jgi:hypothetical protein
MDDGTVDGMDDGQTDGRTDGKFHFIPTLHGKLHFIPKLHNHDVAEGWTGQMMNEKSFISSRPRQTTTPDDHA